MGWDTQHLDDGRCTKAICHEQHRCVSWDSRTVTVEPVAQSETQTAVFEGRQSSVSGALLNSTRE